MTTASAKNLRLFEATNVFKVTVSPPASLAADYTLTLPTDAGASGQVLSTDGAGVLSWISSSGSGTVTSIASGTGLTGGPITGAGTLSVNVGTTANKIVQLDGSAKLPAVDGSALTNLDPTHLSAAVGMAKGGTGLTSIGTSNQVMGVNSGATGLEYKTITAGSGVTVTHGANSITIAATGGGSGTVTSIASGTGLTGGPITGTGTFAVDVGTSANQIVQLDGSAKLPAVDGSALTNLNATNLSSGTVAAARLPALTGDVTSSAGSAATTVATVGGSTAANVHAAELLANAATNANTASAIVKRDASGNFSAGAVSVGSSILRDTSTGTITMAAPSSVTSYSLTWPSAVGTNGYLLSTDGSGNLSWVAPSAGGGGSVTSIASGTGLTGGPISSTGTFAVDVGTTANKIVQLDGSAHLPAVDGSALTALNASNLASGTVAAARLPALTGDVTTSAGSAATTVAQIQGTAVDATAPNTAGQVLRYNGTSKYIAGFLSLADIRSTVIPGNTMFPSTSCTAAETMTWSSLTDTMSCTSIAISHSAVSGLGTAALLDVGTSASQVVQLDGSAHLPAVDGSAVTNLDPTHLSAAVGTAKGGTGLTSIGTANQVMGVNSGATGLEYKTMTAGTGVTITHGANSITIAAAGSGGTVTSIASGTGLTGGPITGTGTFTVDVGTSANQIVQLDGSAKLPAVDGSALTALNASNISSGTLAAGRLPALTGDVTTSAGSASTTVATVGTSTAANVHAAEVLANAATDANTASAIVKRDASGNFSAGAVSVGSSILRDAATGTITLAAPTSVTSYTLTWPTAVGTNGQVLSTNASGVLSWVSAASGSVTSIASGTGLTGGPISSTGTFAVDVGTTANKIVQLDGSAKLPAVDGSALTNLDPTHLSAGVATNKGGTGLTSIGTASQILGVNTGGNGLEYKTVTAGTGVTITPTANTITISAAGSGGTVTSIASGTGLTGGPITGTGTFTVDVGTAANKIVQLDASAHLPAVDGSALTALNASNLASGTVAAARLPALTGDVTTSAGSASTTVATVGTSTAANIHAAEVLANAATNANTASAIVKRDASGNFSADAVSIGSAILRDSTTNTITMAAPTSVTSYTLTWPAAVGTSGQVLSTNASGVLSWVSAASGSVTSIASGTGLTGGPISSTGTFAVDVGTAANKIVQLDASAHLPAVDGSALTALNASNLGSGTVAAARLPAFTGDVTTSAGSAATTVAKIQGVAVSATAPTTSGMVLRYASGTTNYIAGFLSLADIRSTVTPGNTMFPATTCTAAQTMTWSSLTDTMTCSAIAIASTAVSGLGTAAALDVGTTLNKVVQLDGSAKLPAVDGSALTNLDPTHLSAAVGTAKGGTGLTSAGTANQVLGMNSGASALEYKTMTAGTGITVTHGTNTITIAASGGTGTVTSIATGTGLTGGPITATGTIALASMATNTLLANATGGSAAPAAVTATAYLDSAFSSTQGSLLYRNATVWTALAPGTSGYGLHSQGASANLQWSQTDLTSGVTGALPVANGGTGTTNGSITGTGALTFTAGGTNTNVTLTPNGTGYTVLNGSVGVGTTSPRSTLEVLGTIISKAAVSNATSTVDFSGGNLQYTTSNCGAFQLNNLKDGGSYSFFVKGTTSATCSFTAYSGAGTGSLTVHMPPGHTATTASTHTVYALMVAGSDVYVAWTPGY